MLVLRYSNGTKARFAVVLAIVIAAMAPMASAEPALGKWDVRKDTDVMDDSVRMSSGLPDDEGDAYLQIRCWRDTTEAYVIWGDEGYFGEASAIEVQTRVDDDPMDSATWSVSKSGAATFFPNETLVDFLDRIADASRLIVRVTPPNRSAVTVTFDLEGVRWALMPAADHCGWLWMLAADASLVNDESVAWALSILYDFASGKGDTPELGEYRPQVKEAFEFLEELESESDSE